MKKLLPSFESSETIGGEMADKICAIDETLWASGVSPNWLVAVICNDIYNFIKTLVMPHIADRIPVETDDS